MINKETATRHLLRCGLVKNAADVRNNYSDKGSNVNCNATVYETVLIS